MCVSMRVSRLSQRQSVERKKIAQNEADKGK